MALPEHVQYTPPLPELAPLVSIFAFARMTVTEGSDAVDIFPVGYSVLSFALDDLLQDFLDKDKTLPRFNLTGQTTKFYQLGVKPGRYRFLSAVLKPCSAYRLFGFPQNTLVDTFIDIATLSGTDMQTFQQQMLANQSEPEKAMQLLQEWLIARLSTKVNLEKIQSVQEACDRIDAGNGVKTIKEVYTGMGISKSTLERNFLEVVGITPKMYSRIVRFNKVYNVLQHGQYNTWQEVIYNFNFYDQAHFIKDFKKFFNRTPSEVHKSRINSNELLGSAGS